MIIKTKKINIEHNLLCKKGISWLKMQHYFHETKFRISSCSVVISEMVSMASEHPDVIGFNNSQSILIECKTSKSDFKADFKKHFRRKPDLGMGNFRFYLTKKGLLNIDEIPEKWGLIELDKNKIEIKKEPEYFENTRNAEYPLLFSALRRGK